MAVQKLEGGLRMSHRYTNVKKSRKNQPLISIITVVYNGVEFIERSIQSIINQSYFNTEYIIIDGGSKDGTLEIIKKYNNFITYWLSELDFGLYDAMNKGIKEAKGDYLWFINAGDQIYSHETLNLLFDKHKIDYDAYYGETLIVDRNGKKIGMRRLSTPEKLSAESLANGMVVSHQAFILRTGLAPEYNTRYRFAADFDWMLNALKACQKIKNTKLVLIQYLDGGLTKQNIRKGLRERFAVMRKNYGFFTTLYKHFVLGFRFLSFVSKHKRF